MNIKILPKRAFHPQTFVLPGRLVPLYFLSQDVFSPDVLSPQAFCLLDVLSQQTFCLLDIMSPDFLSLKVLSGHW
jgi:hypothetical protein